MGGKPRRVDPLRVERILEALATTYPEAVVELDFENAFQLTVATILAAQNTDANVNRITPELFSRYPTPQALAEADPIDVEKLVFSTGFYRAKTRSIIGMAKAVVSEFNGEIPRTMKEMVKLPGVARKTANVVLGCAFGITSGIVVDTHVKRLSARLGFTDHTNPVKIERDLCDLWPTEQWILGAHRLIWHGRRVCDSQKPQCDSCSLAPDCPSAELGLPSGA